MDKCNAILRPTFRGSTHFETMRSLRNCKSFTLLSLNVSAIPRPIPDRTSPSSRETDDRTVSLRGVIAFSRRRTLECSIANPYPPQPRPIPNVKNAQYDREISVGKNRPCCSNLLSRGSYIVQWHRDGHFRSSACLPTRPPRPPVRPSIRPASARGK